MTHIYYKYYDMFGKPVIQWVSSKDERRFKEALLEESISRDMGPIYRKDSDGDWIELDYYND